MRGSRFDPDPSKPYGRCKTCGIELGTQGDARSHMDDTMRASGGKSHSVWIANPNRATRIKWEASRIVDSAIDRALEEFDDLVQRGQLTNEEVAEALHMHPDFADAWEDYIDEGDDQ